MKNKTINYISIVLLLFLVSHISAIASQTLTVKNETSDYIISVKKVNVYTNGYGKRFLPVPALENIQPKETKSESWTHSWISWVGGMNLNVHIYFTKINPKAGENETEQSGFEATNDRGTYDIMPKIINLIYSSGPQKSSAGYNYTDWNLRFVNIPHVD